jgi:hypothetical protein
MTAARASRAPEHVIELSSTRVFRVIATALGLGSAH